MIPYPQSLLSIAGARTGIAPTHLLDVQTVDGDCYYFSSRKTGAPAAISASSALQATSVVSTNIGEMAPPHCGDGDTAAAAGIIAEALPTTTTTGSIYIRDAGGVSNAHWKIVWSGFGTGVAQAGALLYYDVSYANENRAGENVFNVSDGAGHFFGNNFFDAGAGTLDVSGWDLSTLTVKIELWQSMLTHLTYPNEIMMSLSGVHVTVPPAPIEYKPWLIEVGPWQFFRSVQSLSGSFVVQNVSGDSMARDVEKILRASSLEGALYVYREWDEAAEAAYREVHGTLTVDDVTETELLLRATGLLNASQGDSLGETYSETCQLVWGSRRCGATGSVECQYSFQSCQVVERFMGVLNSYEKNFTEAIVTSTQRTMNRRRKI